MVAARERFLGGGGLPPVVDLVAMGPNAFHLSGADLTDRVRGLPDPAPATVAVTVSTWVRRRPTPPAPG